ncbi:MAG TPA: tetratricopeptide repeat protein [Humisphaera sp.]|nr:tetratricopeptide repeat protein [Humisphaera sp.]
MPRPFRLAMAFILIGILAGAIARAADPDSLLRGTAPMKWIDRFSAENLPDLEYPSYFNDLDKAKDQAFHGRYRQAILSLSRFVPQKPEEAAVAANIKGQSLAAVGRFEDAIAALSDPKVADDPAIQVRRAQVQAQMGKTDDAIATLREHLRANPDSIAGHYFLGQISEQIGDMKGATAAYTWFNDKPQDYLNRWLNHERGPFDNAEQATLIARGLDRWASLTEQYRNNPTLDKTILNLLVRIYDVIDRTYWPAHQAAGEYFNSHDQAKQAVDELEIARKANPNDARTLLDLGKIAVENFNFDGADKCIDMIRDVDADSLGASLLEVRNMLRERRPELAEAKVQAAIDRQPRNLEALGLQAAVYALELKDDKTNEVLKRIEQIDPTNASAYFEVAEQLGAMRQYPRAAEKYKVAIERAKWWTAARNGLGLLYTQSGDEDNARAELSEAHELDPFNLATTNYLKLLDMMDKFAKKESDHFVVMYDAATDPVIPEYFSEYLESVHAQICKSFNYEPKVKTYIEVFPTHEAFSVRTTGSPWIGTVGASTGRVIALVAPRDAKETMGPFNWAQVLRHEYTHTVTLGATDNRIQHWMTEGLAVYEERTPLRWEWVPMLYNAVKKKELFPIDQLTWSFVRPKRPIDRQLAYAESFWICQYIEENYGHDVILKMLTDFRNAEPQETVFPKETHKSLPDFQADFIKWCEDKVAKWGYDEETTKKYTDLKAKAEGLIKARQYKEAAEAYEELAQMRPVDELPHQRLAGLYLVGETKDLDKAVRELTRLAQVELNDNRYAKRIARVYRDESKWEEAAKYGLIAVYTNPYDLSAHELLATVYEKLGNEKGLEREKRVIADINKLPSQTISATQPAVQ